MKHKPLKSLLVSSARALMRSSITKLLLRSPLRNHSWEQDIYRQFSFGGQSDSLSIDLGSGLRPRNPFACERSTGLDLRPSEQVIQCDLSIQAIPLDSECASVITAFDFLEHVPRALPESSGSIRYPLIELMNEIHRVLEPGGLFFSSTPCYPWPMAYSDPTHVNIMTEETLENYFCKPKIWAKIYGFRNSFDLVDHGWIGGHYKALLRKGL